MAHKIQMRRGTAATWTSTNPVLAAGEHGFETNTGKFKIEDGTTAWTGLAYKSEPGATGPTGPPGNGLEYLYTTGTTLVDPGFGYSLSELDMSSLPTDYYALEYFICCQPMGPITGFVGVTVQISDPTEGTVSLHPAGVSHSTSSVARMEETGTKVYVETNNAGLDGFRFFLRVIVTGKFGGDILIAIHNGDSVANILVESYSSVRLSRMSV